MIKITGIILVVAASVLTGIIMAKDLSKRTKLLKDIRQSAIFIKSDMEYRAPVLEDCFKNRGILFGTAAEYAQNNNCLPKDALKITLDSMSYLKKEDKDIVMSFADNLDTEDIGSQLANVSWLIDALNGKIREAENDFVTKGRLYKSGGVLAGIGLLILLL